MENLKVLSFVLLFSVLVVAWCEKANNQEKYSCEGDEVCPVEQTVETPSIEIEKTPTVIVEANDEVDWEEEFENNEQTVEEPSDQPMMRIMVDENTTSEEVEQDMVNTCANAWWTWADWVCTLEDGSVIAF
jgi:hypothetical protein